MEARAEATSMINTMHCEDSGFIPFIMGLTYMPISDKIGIFEFSADTMYLKGDNLRMLEYKQAIKELREGEV
jgi:hypothetical protein